MCIHTSCVNTQVPKSLRHTHECLLNPNKTHIHKCIKHTQRIHGHVRAVVNAVQQSRTRVLVPMGLTLTYYITM